MVIIDMTWDGIDSLVISLKIIHGRWCSGNKDIFDNTLALEFSSLGIWKASTSRNLDSYWIPFHGTALGYHP